MSYQQYPINTAYSQVSQPIFTDQLGQAHFQQTGTCITQSQPYIPPAYHFQPNYVQNSQQILPAQNFQPPNSSEYEWKTVESRKRNRRDSPEIPARTLKQTVLKDYWLNSPTTSNRFENLSENMNEETEEVSNQAPLEKQKKPPPIFVSGVKYIKPLNDLLQEIAKNGYEIKVLGDEQVKIQSHIPETYNKIIKALDDKETQYHTYQPKNERSFRVVAHNIHYTTDTDELKKELENLGHTVINISNIKQRVTKKPLNLFHIELKQNPNNKDIYTVDRLMNSIVRFEAPHPKRDPPQCIRCQRYGHTQKYCSRIPRCVKCAGDHHTSQCLRKTRSNDVKCVLCSGNHPANYRGCVVYKETQKRKFPPLREKTITANTPNTGHPEKTVKPYQTYAQTAANRQPNSINQQTVLPQQQDQSTSRLEAMMVKLMERMDIMLNLLTTMVSKM